MIWDWLVQRTGKYCSIRRIEYPEFQTGIFGRMESPQYTETTGVKPLSSFKTLQRAFFQEFVGTITCFQVQVNFSR